MRNRSTRRGNSKIVPVTALLFATVLLWISVPNAVAGIAMIVGNAIKSDYMANPDRHQGAIPAEQELMAWRASREHALDWAYLPEAHADLAIISLLEARDAVDIPVRGDLIQAARDHAIDAVRRDPTNGFLWMRLGHLDTQTQQPPEIALASLRASLETAPFQPTLIGQRIRFGFKYWPSADDALRAVLLEQLKLLVVAGRLQNLDKVVRANPFYVPLIRAQFDGSDGVQQRIDRVHSEQENADSP